MPMYRKNPIVIEARQFTAADAMNGPDVARWCRGEYLVDAIGPCVLIDTLEGQMRADPGDWIAKGVRGEFYPIKPDIFDASYSEVVQSSVGMPLEG